MKKKLSMSLLFFISIIFYSNAQTGIWEELKPTNSPSPRWSFGMAEIGEEKVILFGGKNDKMIFDETWIYDFQLNSWSEIQNDIHPSRRIGHQIARISKNKVLLFGGESFESNNSEIINDTWVFDLGTLTWTDMKPSMPPPNL